MIPACTANETIAKFEKLTLNIPSTEINKYTNNNYLNAIYTSIESKNHKNKCANIVGTNSDIQVNQNNICNKTEMDAIDFKIDKVKNKHSEIISKKQKNVSFSNQKLWEINRVNTILHKKISSGVKPTYSRQNPSTLFVKATSTINRERQNKDIIKENAVSFILVKTNICFENITIYYYIQLFSNLFASICFVGYFSK